MTPLKIFFVLVILACATDFVLSRSSAVSTEVINEGRQASSGGGGILQILRNVPFPFSIPAFFIRVIGGGIGKFFEGLFHLLSLFYGNLFGALSKIFSGFFGGASNVAGAISG